MEIWDKKIREVMDLVFIKTLKSMVDIDIRDESLREELMESLEMDRVNGGFDLGKYLRYYDYFGKLGKTQLDIWRLDENLKKFYGGIGVLLAVSRLRGK